MTFRSIVLLALFAASLLPLAVFAQDDESPDETAPSEVVDVGDVTPEPEPTTEPTATPTASPTTSETPGPTLTPPTLNPDATVPSAAPSSAPPDASTSTDIPTATPAVTSAATRLVVTNTPLTAATPTPGLTATAAPQTAEIQCNVVRSAMVRDYLTCTVVGLSPGEEVITQCAPNVGIYYGEALAARDGATRISQRADGSGRAVIGNCTYAGPRPGLAKRDVTPIPTGAP